MGVLIMDKKNKDLTDELLFTTGSIVLHDLGKDTCKIYSMSEYEYEIHKNHEYNHQLVSSHITEIVPDLINCMCSYSLLFCDIIEFKKLGDKDYLCISTREGHELFICLNHDFSFYYFPCFGKMFKEFLGLDKFCFEIEAEKNNNTNYSNLDIEVINYE